MTEEFTTIAELGYGAPGTKLELRIVRTWTPQVRTYETWFLAVDKHVSMSFVFVMYIYYTL